MCTLWRIRERTTYAVDWHSSAQKADAWDQSLPWCHEIKLYALLEAAWEQKSHKFTKNRAKLIAGRITSRQWLRTMERNRTLSSPIWCFCTSKSQSKHRGPLSRMINHCEKNTLMDIVLSANPARSTNENCDLANRWRGSSSTKVSSLSPKTT